MRLMVRTKLQHSGRTGQVQGQRDDRAAHDPSGAEVTSVGQRNVEITLTGLTWLCPQSSGDDALNAIVPQVTPSLSEVEP